MKIPQLSNNQKCGKPHSHTEREGEGERDTDSSSAVNKIQTNDSFVCNDGGQDEAEAEKYEKSLPQCVETYL